MWHMVWDWLWTGANGICTITGVMSAYTLWSTRKYSRSSKLKSSMIKIIVTTQTGEGQKELCLPFETRRDQLSRAELQGLLGMYFKAGQYDRDGIRECVETGALNQVLAGTLKGDARDRLRIRMTKVDFETIRSAIAASQSGTTPAKSGPSR